MSAAEPRLVVTADDYGYAPAYNHGILVAARVGAVDAVGAMVTRAWCDPAPLVATGREVGLHLELRPGVPARAQVERQVAVFRRLFGGPPAWLDGHRHCHARPGVAEVVAELAASASLPVRSVSPQHRDLVRSKGAATNDLLIGRLRPGEPAVPPELRALPDGVTEWMVHPGARDPAGGSSYDSAREEDLEILLAGIEVSSRSGRAVRRCRHTDLTA